VDVRGVPVLPPGSSLPLPITDVFLATLPKASKGLLPPPSGTNVRGWVNDGPAAVNLNPKGVPTYLQFARDPTRPPITALAVTTAPLPPSEGWDTLPTNLNEGSKGATLFLHYCREPGAAPVVDLTLVSNTREMPNGWHVVTPELNSGLGWTDSLYLCFLLGERNPASFKLVASEPGAQADADGTEEDRSDGRKVRAVVRGSESELLAIQYLKKRVLVPLISLEVDGWTPLEGIPVDTLGEATYAVRRLRDGAQARLVVHVVAEEDVKHVVVRSPLLCYNSFDFPLEVQCQMHPSAPAPVVQLAPKAWFSPPLGSMDIMPPGSKLRPLFRFWSPVKHRHFYCTDPHAATRLHPSFVQETVLGYVFAEPFDGTIPLWGSRSETHHTRFACFTNRRSYDKGVRLIAQGGRLPRVVACEGCSCSKLRSNGGEGRGRRGENEGLGLDFTRRVLRAAGWGLKVGTAPFQR
jgi:hypothetical protein